MNGRDIVIEDLPGSEPLTAGSVQATPVPAADPQQPDEVLAWPPTQERIDAYRAAIFEAVETGGTVPQDLVGAAGRLDFELQQDLKTYRARLAADDTLKNKLPQLQAAVDAAKQTVADAQAMETAPLQENLSRIAGITGLTADASARDWVAGLMRFFGHQIFPAGVDLSIVAALGVGFVSQCRAEQSRAEGRLQRAKDDAIKTLKSTASPSIEREVRSIRDQISHRRGAIYQRKEITDIDATITTCVERCRILASGKDPDPDPRLRFNPYASPLHDLSGREESRIREKYLSERKKLDVLRQQAVGKAEALAASERDARAILALEAKIPGIQARTLDPRQMRWAGE